MRLMYRVRYYQLYGFVYSSYGLVLLGLRKILFPEFEKMINIYLYTKLAIEF